MWEIFIVHCKDLHFPLLHFSSSKYSPQQFNLIHIKSCFPQNWDMNLSRCCQHHRPCSIKWCDTLEGSGHHLIQSMNHAFIWREWGQQWKLSRIVSVMGKIWTRWLLNTNQKCYYLSQLLRLPVSNNWQTDNVCISNFRFLKRGDKMLYL
jgi:hypothetical protein